MTKINLPLRRRRVIITVAEVLTKKKEGAAGFPSIEILDTRKREHEISYIDCITMKNEFEKIEKGFKLEVTIDEKISCIYLHPPKKKKE